MIIDEYTIWMGLALLVGVVVTLWRGRVVGIEEAALRTALQVVVAGAAIGGVVVGILDKLAALTYASSVLIEPPVIQGDLLLQSELSAHGTLLGGVTALVLWGRKRPGLGWQVADVMAPGVAVVMALLWGSNWHSGLVYGVPDQSVMALPAPDANGLTLLRWPVPLVAGAAFGALALFVSRFGPFPPGALALFMLWAANSIWFLLGFFRDDPTFYLGTFRKDQFIALIWLGASAALLPPRWRRAQDVRE